jgi:rhodanese-related sulfurtransferase
MKYFLLTFVFAAGFAAAHLTGLTSAAPPQQQPAAPNLPGALNPDRLAPANPNIDFNAYMKIAAEAAQHRAKRRLTEEDFIEMSQEKGVIVLDARSKEKYDLLHVKGAINLSFPDIDIESLKKTLPDKDAKILIYCNNNFTAGAPASSVTVTPGGAQPGQGGKVAAAFPSKSPALSLNISTYTALYGYGYKNVYELGPLVDPAKTKLKLVSTEK